MIICDSHVHTEFSTDSETKMEDMVTAAINSKLQAITFTDHMDYFFPEKYSWNTPDGMPAFTFDLESYFEKIQSLKEIHKEKIEIRCGVEVGLKNQAQEKNRQLCSNPKLDYVIGSTHLVEDIDPYDSEYWEAFEEKQGLLKYFETTLMNLNSLEDIHIDSLGHLDYIVRYAPSGYKLYSYQAFSDIIDAILQILIERQIALEVNTSGYRNGSSMPNPEEKIIRRYQDMGGELIVFGSDAHTTDRLAKDFDRAEKLVRAAGFDHYVTFRQRKPVYHSFE